MRHLLLFDHIYILKIASIAPFCEKILQTFHFFLKNSPIYSEQMDKNLSFYIFYGIRDSFLFKKAMIELIGDML